MFTVADIEDRSLDERELLRAREVLVCGRLQHTEMDGDDFCAVCRGSDGSQHRIRVTEALDGSACSCQAFNTGRRSWCKHVAAAALLWLDVAPSATSFDPSLVAAVEALDLRQARELLIQAAGRADVVRRRLLHDTWSEPQRAPVPKKARSVKFPIDPPRPFPLPKKAAPGRPAGASAARRWPKPAPLNPRRARRDSAG